MVNNPMVPLFKLRPPHFSKTTVLVLLIGILLPRMVAGDGIKLEQNLKNRLTEMQCPGALIGVFPDAGKPTRIAVGVGDLNTKQPMTLDMHMRIGSVSKPFLGTVVLQLAAEDKLSLDDPIAKFVDGVPQGRDITLRMLGQHTSGLFNSIENADFQQAIMIKPGKAWQAEDILSFSFSQHPYNAPGTQWRYSNTNAILLGMVVEKVTGNKYEDEIYSRICVPLGLKRTNAPKDGKLPLPHPIAYRNGQKAKVIGYGDVLYDVTGYSSSWTHAAGNLYSTLDDLGKAARCIATGSLLSKHGRKELFDWSDTKRENLQHGFFIFQYKDGSIGHAGDVPGYNAVIKYYPAKRLSIVALTNISNNKDGTMPAEELAELTIQSLCADQK